MADRTTSTYESGESDRLPARDHELYNRIAQESDFIELRRRYQSFAFPATIGFMAWYVTYIICNNWARDFMNTIVVGNINVALDLRTAAVRVDLHDRLLLRPPRQQVVGPARHRASR